MASQALKVFRTFLKEPIISLNESVDSFIRPAYFGGRTEIFKPLFWGGKDDLLASYDVNSLYPTVMLDEFPTNFNFTTMKYYPDKMGFYEAEVEVPEDMYIPPLGTVFKIDGTNKFIFPAGRVRGRWSTVELEYARSLGVKIVWTGQGVIFHNGGHIFKEYIEELYKIRESSPKDSVSNILAKLLMNSCYGRMGLRRDREKITFDEGQPGIKIIAEIPIKGTDTVIRLGTEPKILETSFSNVAIAAWVTSLARIHMHKIYSEASDKLYYTDTDSLFTKKRYKADKKLGGLKLEYECDSACFLLPKTYLVHATDRVFKSKDAEGEDIMEDKKIVMKGFSRDSIRKLDMDDFFEALEGELRLMKIRNGPNGIVTFKKLIREEGFHLLKVLNKGKGIETFRTAAKKGSFLRKRVDEERSIKSLYDKRVLITKANGVIDSEPLIIRNNVIVNMGDGRAEYAVNEMAAADQEQIIRRLTK